MRYAGQSKFNYWKLWNFALEGFTSFTAAPLKLSTYFGLLVSGASFLYAGIIVFKTLVRGDIVQGYPSLVTIVLFLGGVQLLAIGILGEYIGRMFNETKRRPLYLVDSISGVAHAPTKDLFLSVPAVVQPVPQPLGQLD